MSKKVRSQKKDAFEPKVGFDKRDENEESLSLSDFEIEGKAPQAISFFSESDKGKDETPESNNENQEALHESGDLNHAFFEENSESATDKEVSEFFKQEYDNTAIAPKEIDHNDEVKIGSARKDSNEIIVSKGNSNEKVVKNEIVPSSKESPRINDKDSNFCCKCKSCLIL